MAAQCDAHPLPHATNLWTSPRMNIKLSNCYAIGDSPRDIEASVAAKCIPLAVRTGNGYKIENNNKFKVPIFDDLYDAVDFVLKN